MPLPSYIPRSDSFGNWYFGGFQVDSSVEAGYGAATGINHTESDFQAFLTAAIGANNWFKNGSNYYFRFDNPYEPLSGIVSNTANYRFVWFYGSVGNPFAIYVAPTGSPLAISTRPYINFIGSTILCVYAVANQYGMWLVQANKSTSPGELTTTVSSAYMGWVKDPVFPNNTYERVRNLVVGVGSSESGINFSFMCTGAANSAGAIHYCNTSSAITCDVATPGANITDLCFLDINQSYLNIGSAYNALFYPGTGLTVGQIYRIPPADDPDGNTEQNIWLCAGQVYGWDGSEGVANAGYKLIRVWSNNIT